MAELDVEPVDDADAESDAGDGAPAEHGHGTAAADDTTVEVEATSTDATLPEGVDAPEYVLYGGKGGVGKTTMAASTALASAAGGVPTLVVSTDPAHSLSDTLATEIPAHPSRIREDIPLFAAEIDPEEAMEEGVFGADGDPLGGMGGMGAGGDTDASGAGAGPMGAMAGALGDEGFDPTMAGSMPGADEAAAMRQLLEYLDDPRFDRVVVDTAPTGHTLRLLELPEMLDSMMGRMMKLRQQFSGMMEGVKGMFGGGENADPSADLDELQDRIERLRAVLRDPARTDFRVVMVPEEMSVVESQRLIKRLDGFGIPVQTLVVNRVMEPLSDVADVDPDWLVSANVEECEFCSRRWDVQQTALQRAMDLFRGRDVKRVPLLADEVRGEEALRIVAACLH
ncbi:ArsA family ATPase [Salinirubrum litoreum]|uniref:ArsA family ATPase n=1 Tax=Salinirubrum litoreum TaxID=1126234 RepID=A0ABD5R5T8_9EURY|nr:TRC40/GET3/ArsA family transport-energizing ATPase [Salinirubrum litoreum]